MENLEIDNERLEQMEQAKENLINYGKWLERFNLEDNLDNYDQYLVQGGYRWIKERNERIKDEIEGYFTELKLEEKVLIIGNDKIEEYFVLNDFDFRFNDNNTLLHIYNNNLIINIPINDNIIVDVGLSLIFIGDYFLDKAF